MNTEWTQTGHGVDTEWTCSGRCVDSERTQSGHWVDVEWTQCGCGVDAGWTLRGHGVDLEWTQHGPQDLSSGSTLHPAPMSPCLPILLYQVDAASPHSAAAGLAVRGPQDRQHREASS